MASSSGDGGTLGRIDALGPKCVLETPWLKGHLGRTIYPRADDMGEARFLEFFHANLRDHQWLRNVMASPGKTPTAWGALDARGGGSRVGPGAAAA